MVCTLCANTLILSAMMLIAVSTGQNLVPPKDICKGKLICDSVPNYPADKVTAAVKAEEKNLKDFFGTEPLIRPADSIMSRLGTQDPKEETLCTARTETVFPQAGETSKGEERFIINNAEYKQGLTVEICSTSGEKCRFSDSFPNGYQATCTQKFALRRMVGLDPSGETLVDYFKIPSCCVCTLKRVV